MKRKTWITILEITGILLFATMSIQCAGNNEERIVANEKFAREKIWEIVQAITSYHAVNSSYPASEDALLNAQPPYMARPAVNNKELLGYKYLIDFDDVKVIATPVECGKTGRKIFTAQEYGISTQDCE